MKKTNKPKFKKEKFKELLLYISEKCENDPDFGAVKLNKVMFYSDFLAYEIWGKPISGAEYIALEHGPGPSQLAPVRAEMEKEEDIIRQKRDRFGRTQVRIIPLRKVDLSAFSANEIALVDNVLEAVCGQNATQLSDISHLAYGWRVARYKEIIPYEAVFISRNDDATPADKERARELAHEYAW